MIPPLCMRLIKMFSFCNVSFSVTTWDRGFIFGMERPTETSEPYLMMTYILWFTALEKNDQFLSLG